MVINRLKYGNTNTYLIRAPRGNLLIDTDFTGTLQAFYRAIKEQDIKLRDISCVLATHYHPDHMGLVSELMKQGVRLLLLDAQRPFIHFSDGIFGRSKGLSYEPINEGRAEVIGFRESRSFLESLGIEGEIIHTPSHSEDSICLVLDSGECFAGDLEPLEYLGAYGENEKLKKDWELVLSYQPKTVYFAHRNEWQRGQNHRDAAKSR